ncbi:MAG: hypothetical protein ABI655_06080 [Phenylobacterium sp.]
MRPALPPTLLIAAALLAGCAYVATAPQFLSGKKLNAAVAQFGPWSEHRTTEGNSIYIWRSHAVDNGVDTVCELQVTTAYGDTIASSSVRGYPAACGRFRIALAKPPARKPATPHKTK